MAHRPSRHILPCAGRPISQGSRAQSPRGGVSRIASLTRRAEATRSILSTEILRSPLSTEETNVRWSPESSASFSWEIPSCIRARRTFVANVMRAGASGRSTVCCIGCCGACGVILRGCCRMRTLCGYTLYAAWLYVCRAESDLWSDRVATPSGQMGSNCRARTCFPRRGRPTGPPAAVRLAIHTQQCVVGDVFPAHFASLKKRDA